MYRKFILIFLSVFSFTYAVDEIENKYIENGYITTKIGLDISKSDFEIGKISIFVLEGKIAKVIYGRGAILNNSRDLTQSQLEKLSEIGSKYIKDTLFQNIYKFKRRKTN